MEHGEILTTLEDIVTDCGAELIIFDLDNTLLQYRSTQPYQAVDKFVIELIMKRDSFSEEQAKNILERIKEENQNDNPNNPPDISLGIKKRYGLSTDEYFAETWGKFDPGDFADKNESLVTALRNLNKKGVQMAVLTNAPRIWAQNVLSWLGTADMFEGKLWSGAHKEELRKPDPQAFKQICDHYKISPEKMLAVGDSFGNDLLPAEKLGAWTLIVTQNARAYEADYWMPTLR